MEDRAAARVRTCALLALLLCATACDARERDARAEGDPVGLTGLVRASTLEPGAPTRQGAIGTYQENEWTVYAGERLYAWLNCVGCHANGGGGIGPPLADEEWIYGSEPIEIFATIWQGRADGMPAFAGRIGPQQAWLLVAYVRALAGLTPPELRADPAAHLRAGAAADSVPGVP